MGKSFHKSDVLIVGGGPAGSACARKLVLGGASALILDKAEFPRIKPCAGWITPKVLQLLQPLFGEYPHSLTSLSCFDVSVWNLRFLMPTKQYAIRRLDFDHWLLQTTGATVQQHQVRDIKITTDGYLVDDQFFAPFLVGAGGSYCPVRKKLFLAPQESYPDIPISSHEYGKPGNPGHEAKGPNPARTTESETLIIALEAEFTYPHRTTACRLWFFQDKLPGYAWYVPKADGYVNIGVGAKAHSLLQRGSSIKHHWDALMHRLDHERLVIGREDHPLSHSYRTRRRNSMIQQGSAYLIGDAAGLATVDMGEGLGPAIQSGILAADAILSGAEYKLAAIPRYSFPSILGLRRDGHTIA